MGRLFPALLLISVLTWGVSLTFGFVWDDRPTVLENRSILEGGRLVRALAADFWAFHDEPGVSGYWRPAATLSYAAVARLAGLEPWAFHSLNVLLHAANALLAALLFGALGLSSVSLWIAALFFALHPLHAEAVSFVSALPDLLAAFFGLGFLALLARGEGMGPPRWAAATAALLLAFLSKESAAIFAVAAPLFVLTVRKRGFAAPRPAILAAVIFPALALWAAAHFAVTGGMGVRSPWGGGWGTHLATVLTLLPFSALLSLIPFSTTPTRAFPVSGGWADPAFWTAALTVGVLVLAVVHFRKKSPLSALGAVVFLLFWLPVSNLIPAEGLIADRYLYLPILGTAIVVGEIAAGVLSKIPLKAARLVPVFLTVAWAFFAVRSSLPWRNEETLWRHAVRVSEGSNLAWNALGKVLLDQGRLDGAAEAFTRALERTPGYREAFLNLALVRIRSGDAVGAEGILEQARRIHPNDAEVLSLEAEINALRGDWPAAVESARRAAELEPGRWSRWFNLGTLRLRTRDPSGASLALEKARELGGDRRGTLMNLAAARTARMDYAGARELYERVLSRWPGDGDAERNLKLIGPILQEIERMKSR